jgi:hypothetical protein
MRSDFEVQYELLENCILAGQVSDRQLVQMMRADPAFALWLRTRTGARTAPRTLSERLATRVPRTGEDVDLISLAAWLWRLAKQAEASPDLIRDPEGVVLTWQDAARLARASEIVKDAADQQRQEKAAAGPGRSAANEA